MLVRSERRKDSTMDDFPTPRFPVNIKVIVESCPPLFSSLRPPLSVSAFPFPFWSCDRKWGSSFELAESSSVWSVPSVQGSSRCRKLVKLRTCRITGLRLLTIYWSTRLIVRYLPTKELMSLHRFVCLLVGLFTTKIGSHWRRCLGERGRLSWPSWLLGAL